jgi:hypothetical protein
MNSRLVAITIVGTLGLGIGIFLGRNIPAVEGQTAPASPSFAAVPGHRGGQDHTGPYDVVSDWPKPLSQLPGHEKWTWGAVQGIFAESPNRVFVLMRGELPKLERPEEVPYPSVGPSLSFPVSQTPFRNASVGPVSSPGNSGSDGWNGWKGRRCPVGAQSRRRQRGRSDRRVVDAVG